MRGVRAAILLLLALSSCLGRSELVAAGDEVAAPRQYPYVPDVSIKNTLVIAGEFSPSILRSRIALTHATSSGSMRMVAPFTTIISPGKTVLVRENWL